MAKFFGIEGEGDQRRVEYEIQKGERKLTDYNAFIQALLHLSADKDGNVKNLELIGLHGIDGFSNLSTELQNAITAFLFGKKLLTAPPEESPFQTGTYNITGMMRLLNSIREINDEVKRLAIENMTAEQE